MGYVNFFQLNIEILTKTMIKMQSDIKKVTWKFFLLFCHLTQSPAVKLIGKPRRETIAPFLTKCQWLGLCKKTSGFTNYHDWYKIPTYAMCSIFCAFVKSISLSHFFSECFSRRILFMEVLFGFLQYFLLN